ncbi:MAG: hypothetical protein E2O35_05325 [Proteobacteria bacterium]|nr:MAG: hypothetical protein E2O35_05325 [Pseudomonadota bacterium]
MRGVCKFISQRFKLKVNEGNSAVDIPHNRVFRGVTITGGKSPNQRKIAAKSIKRHKTVHPYSDLIGGDKCPHHGQTAAVLWAWVVGFRDANWTCAQAQYNSPSCAVSELKKAGTRRDQAPANAARLSSMRGGLV